MLLIERAGKVISSFDDNFAKGSALCDCGHLDFGQFKGIPKTCGNFLRLFSHFIEVPNINAGKFLILSSTYLAFLPELYLSDLNIFFLTLHYFRKILHRARD